MAPHFSAMSCIHEGPTPPQRDVQVLVRYWAAVNGSDNVFNEKCSRLTNTLQISVPRFTLVDRLISRENVKLIVRTWEFAGNYDDIRSPDLYSCAIN